MTPPDQQPQDDAAPVKYDIFSDPNIQMPLTPDEKAKKAIIDAHRAGTYEYKIGIDRKDER